MNYSLIKRIDAEREVAIKKWGDTDRTPEILLNAVTEEVGEVAHAINHKEGVSATQQEIVEAMSVLARLYEMVEQEL
ncbi:hypothetical protein ES703_87988 [subsurface metagenome]